MFRIVLTALVMSALMAGSAHAQQPGRLDRLDKMIGQMILIGFQGTSPRQRWPRRVAAQLRAGEIGGVLFLGQNVKSTPQGRASAANIKGIVQLFKNAGAVLPPFIAVDQEGGAVSRLSAPDVGFPRLPSPKRMARIAKRPDLARARYRASAARLNRWGFNLNLAPPVDLDINRANPVIGAYGRSYSADPVKVTQFARVFIEAHRAEGVLTALKHFPGHGSSKRDSHKGFVDISRTWSKTELEPFRNLIASGHANLVVTGHLILSQYQNRAGGREPATFSRPLIEGVLRGKLKFDGVVATDDLQMGAIRKHYRFADAIVRAVAAGHDLLVISNTAKPRLGLPRVIRRILKAQAEKDPALRARIERSYRRILALKRKLD